MLNRIEALEWCVNTYRGQWVKSVDEFAPDGWTWFDRNGNGVIVLQLGVSNVVEPITPTEWANNRKPPLAIPQPTKTREQALEWCAKNVKTWVNVSIALHNLASPWGWTWELDGEGVYLNPNEPFVTTITKRDWEDFRERGIPAEQTTVKPSEWQIGDMTADGEIAGLHGEKAWVMGCTEYSIIHIAELKKPPSLRDKVADIMHDFIDGEDDHHIDELIALIQGDSST